MRQTRYLLVIACIIAAGASLTTAPLAGAQSRSAASGDGLLLAQNPKDQRLRAIERRRFLQRQQGSRANPLQSNPYGSQSFESGRPSRSMPPSGTGSMTVPNR